MAAAKVGEEDCDTSMWDKPTLMPAVVAVPACAREGASATDADCEDSVKVDISDELLKNECCSASAGVMRVSAFQSSMRRIKSSNLR